MLAIAIHSFVIVKGWRTLVFIDLIFHIGSILLFLLLEMSLQHVFIFLLSSATANMLIQWIVKSKNDAK